jgi:hypothetical protein
MEAKDTMGRKTVWGFNLVWLAVLGMVVPIPALQAADRPAAPVAMSRDVALSADGMLRGQVLSPQGLGVPGVHVAVSSAARDLGSTVTNAEGRFEIAGLKGGVLTLAAGQSRTTVRAWTPKAAPPASQSEVLLVAGQSQTLGQSWGGFKSVITNPWVIAGIVAAAVAIPVAIHNSNDDGPASP